MMTKELNKEQLKCLLNDILNNKVKLYGNYIYNGLNIKVTRNKKLTPNESIKDYFTRQPEKAKKYLQQKRMDYYMRKMHGICIKCELPSLPDKVMCYYHNLKHNEQQNARLRKGNKNAK